MPARVQSDLLRLSAVVPTMAPQVARRRIDEPRDVKWLRVRLEGARLPEGDLDGVGQVADGEVIELHDRQTLEAGPADPDASRYLSPKNVNRERRSDILAGRGRPGGREGTRCRAERITRYVNGSLDKKRGSRPSAREVLRTQGGEATSHALTWPGASSASRAHCRSA